MTMSIDAKDFEAKCLKLMDEVAETGKTLVITKDGIPVAQLSPVQPKLNTIIGAMKGSIAIKGDIVSPLDADLETFE